MITDADDAVAAMPLLYAKNIGGSSKTVLRMSLLVRSRFVFHHGQPLNEVYAIRHALPIIACASPKQRIPVPAHAQTGIGAVQCASVLRKDSEAYAVGIPRPLSRKHIRDPEQETSLPTPENSASMQEARPLRPLQQTPSSKPSAARSAPPNHLAS